MPPQRFVSTRFTGSLRARGFGPQMRSLSTPASHRSSCCIDPTRTTTDINAHVNVEAKYADVELMQMELMNDRTHRKSAPTT